jgi:general secretion pathway protein K
MTRVRQPDAGVILINVLVTVALSSTVVFAMLQLSDTAITRSQRYGDAGQALALMAGGEATAMAALRRDQADAATADHLAESWALIGQDDIAIEGGRFTLTIADAQDRFNLTNAAQGRPEALQILQRILRVLDLPEAVGLRILARLANPAPVNSTDDLLDAGLSPEEVARLQTLVTVLPRATSVNINTMPDAMFAVLAANPVQARLLQGLRTRNGQLTQADLQNAGLFVNTEFGMASSFFRLTTRVTQGETTLASESLIARQTEAGGDADGVFVAARRAVP